jgi:hypothetical protein
MACFVPRSAILRTPYGSVRKDLAGSLPKNLAGSAPKNRAGSISKNFAGAALKKILIVGSCLVALGWVQPAVAQVRGGGHVPGGAHAGAPVRVPMSRAPILAGPRGGGPGRVGPHFVGPGGVRLGPRPINLFRRRFFDRPFFWFPLNSLYLSFWWPSCGPGLGWGFAVECYPQPFYGYGFQSYVTPPIYEPPVYWYGETGPDLVWLYLKDGAAYPVTDYWFVDGQVHFTTVEDDPRKPAEHMIPRDDLDVEKSTFVNTRRGFRMVVRDEPWRQYLKDHPEATPPDLAP